jgi:hypothetical protein
MHFRLVLTAFVLLVAASMESQSARKTIISLHKTLGSDYACEVYQRPIQFLSEDELVLLAGPTSDCYRGVNNNQLVVISLDRHVIARKAWPSTDPGTVFSGKRLAVAASEQLLILDDHLTVVQSFPLPKHRGFPILYGTEGGLSVDTDGGSLDCDGTPLKCIERKTGLQPDVDGYLIHSFDDGRKLLRKDESLIETAPGASPKKIADLSWVSPHCEKYEYCQAYDAGTRYQVVNGKRRRVLIMSNGSKYPITDAAGLFPFFRIQVFDLDVGSEIYREEDVLRTGHRSAVISPDGDLLATFNGLETVIHHLD